MKHRMSSLPVIQYCPGSAKLSDDDVSSRAAFLGTVFHRWCSDERGAEELFAQLSLEEKAEVSSWHRPMTLELDGQVFEYASAETELEVGLTHNGQYCDADDPNLATLGHLDMAWHDGNRAVVVDIKRGLWTSSADPHSLQLLAYGLAYASKVDADVVQTGIWSAVDGYVKWGEPFEMDSEFASEALKMVLSAAKAAGGFVTGAHCRTHCYHRQRCPAYALPVAEVDNGASLYKAISLEDITTPDKARELLQFKERASQTLDALDGLLKEYVKKVGPIPSERGDMEYNAVQCKGRDSFDSKAALTNHPELARFIRRGKPYHQFRWSKVKV